jgi:hypothetical protein
LTSFESGVQRKLGSILKYDEPPFCTAIMGVDDVSRDYPPHKAVRLVVSAVVFLSQTRFATLFLLGIVLVLSPLFVRLAVSVRLGLVVLCTVFGVIGSREMAKGVFLDIERCYLYWRLNMKRRDFTTWEISRINHAFLSFSLKHFAWMLTLVFAFIIFCFFLFVRSWMWGVTSLLLGYFFWSTSQVLALHAAKQVFVPAAKRPEEETIRQAKAAESRGELPGDRTLRSSKSANLTTGRLLRLPSTRCSLLLAYISGFTFVVFQLSIYVPITRYQAHSWTRYTPLKQVALFCAMWLTMKWVQVFKASDKRQFQTILLRAFQPSTSDYSKNAVIPVLGSLGTGITVEDSNYKQAKPLLSLPFAVTQDLVSGPASVVPYVKGSDWKLKVGALIASSDAAVIDISGSTEAVDWEVERCRANFPPDRMIFLLKGVSFYSRFCLLPARVALGSSASGQESHVIGYEPGLIGRFVFKWRLLRVFKQIRKVG